MYSIFSHESFYILKNATRPLKKPVPEPMPMKTRQTMNTTKAFGNTMMHVATMIRTQPP